jgi:stearoyl-CoA desaturase (delta-9 desaturase)
MNQLIYVLVTTHITIMCVTLFLHRGQAHKAVEFHPILEHFMRFWLWLTTGMITKQWVAIHRKHHRFSDLPDDPHSPQVYGIFNILFRGLSYYVKEGKNVKTILTYGKGTPNDWIERKLYTPHNFAGVFLYLFIDLFLFGWSGLIVWLVQIYWIPFWAAGVINGLGHYFGYRNTDTKEKSTNILPIGIFIGGEELHNNHHAQPASPKLSMKWYEIDIGWIWLKIFELFRLAKIKKISLN